ncbi:MAG: hypothetical protein UHX00_15180 [Caryophanon sp.]|nr:hypothetical protein [Caryophanon sp.]
MRNAYIQNELVVTVDNSVAIGEKPLDAVHAPNTLVAAYTMRVLLLEQMCANARIHCMTVGNGSGEDAFTPYMEGIRSIFAEIDEAMPPYIASTETNMETQQSALTITAIGTLQAPRTRGKYRYVIGHPHVGQGVLDYSHEIAPLAVMYELWQRGIITHVWPTGSKGLAHECHQFFHEVPALPITMDVTCGPSSVVLVYANERLQLDVPYYEV